MPNKIYIQILTKTVSLDAKKNVLDKKGKIIKLGQSISETGSDVMVFPLKDDIALETKSEMSSWSDMIPGLDTLNTVQGAFVGIGGKANEGLLNLSNMIDAPRWKKTDPIRFNVNLGFYTVDNSKTDVYEPMVKLISLCILTDHNDGTYTPPGLFLPAASMAQAKASKSGSASSSKAKLIAVKIPGIIYMPVAMVESVTPVFSKHITESGYPLWGTLEMAICGIYPAMDTMFNAGIPKPPPEDIAGIVGAAKQFTT